MDKKTWHGILMFIFAIIVLLIVVRTGSEMFKITKEPIVPKVCIKENCLFVEIADTPQERWKGLMDREELDEDAGMLFVFEEEGDYAFWMKGTLIPLDMFWIDKENTIIHIETALPCSSEPCESYISEKKALYVLEANAGYAKKYNITPGEKVKIEI